MLTLLSPTLPTTTGPVCHQRQAGTERSDVAACIYKMTIFVLFIQFLRVSLLFLFTNSSFSEKEKECEP